MISKTENFSLFCIFLFGPACSCWSLKPHLFGCCAVAWIAKYIILIIRHLQKKCIPYKSIQFPKYHSETIAAGLYLKIKVTKFFFVLNAKQIRDNADEWKLEKKKINKNDLKWRNPSPTIIKQWKMLLMEKKNKNGVHKIKMVGQYWKVS